MKNPDEMDMQEYGTYLGYPECCVQSFVRDVASRAFHTRPSRKLTGTGYIPCATCNETKSETELVETINSNRVHPRPFRAVK